MIPWRAVVVVEMLVLAEWVEHASLVPDQDAVDEYVVQKASSPDDAPTTWISLRVELVHIISPTQRLNDLAWRRGT